MSTPNFWIALSAIALLTASEPGRAAAPKEILEKAIEAHGGADLLKKYPAAQATAKGKMNILGMEVVMEEETLYQLPDKEKNTLKLEVGGQKITVVQIYNAGKVRVTANGADTPLSNAQKAEMKESSYLQSLQNLVPLLDSKAFDIGVIDNPDKVKGKAVVGLLVKSKGHKDVKMYFDAKTHVLVKMERMGLNEVEKEVKQELYFLDHKKFDGILCAVKTQMKMEDKVFMESEVTSFKHLDKADAKEFDLSD